MKTWEEYLKQSNHYIQKWEEHHELRELVASLLYDNDRLNNIINELEKYIKTEIPEDDFINNELCVNILDKLQELKEGK